MVLGTSWNSHPRQLLPRVNPCDKDQNFHEGLGWESPNNLEQGSSPVSL